VTGVRNLRLRKCLIPSTYRISHWHVTGYQALASRKFLTPSPVTMARMDRLWGVTMAEKGVSQLVSVDLATAEQFREAG
jgi:hypothetical protein